MFTGLIQDIGTVRSIDKSGDWLIRIATAIDLARLRIGASVACSGICLTIVGKDYDWFAVEVSDETLSRTAIGSWKEGTKLNLEPSLKMGQELGGHFVFGHVDGLAEITAITPQGGSHVITLKAPPEFARFLAPKGSVSIDGISLTINDVAKNSFTVNIIPHTWANTTLGLKRPGDPVHLEIDMLARYVARMLTPEAA
ncbi:MAG: riboflavin synthase [Alphaproteobacteria bacterium]